MRALVACAAVSGPYTFATGVARIERSAEVKEVTEHIWDHEETRDFVLDLSATLSGRRAGLKSDEHRFPGLDVPPGDPTAEGIQARIVEHLGGYRRG